MTKRILALALAVMMVVGLFAGCNTNNGESTTTASTTKAAGTTAAGGTTAATTAPEETPLMNDLGVFPLVNEEVSFTIGLADIGNIVGDLSEHVAWNYLQEKTGITLDYVWYPGEEMNTKIDLAIAAGGKDLPDMLMRDNGYLGSGLQAWGQDGFLVDIAPYLEGNTYWSPIAVNKSNSGSWENLVARTSTLEGALYGFPCWRESWNISGNFFGARASWAIEAGLVEGYYDEENEMYVMEYDENGDYFTTWDQALAYLEYVKVNDMNGNGDPNDEVPLSTSSTSSMRNLQRNVFPSFMGRSATYGTFANPDGAGVLEIHYLRDEYRAATSFINNQLVETGYLDPLSFTQDDTSLKATASLNSAILGATLFTSNAGFSKLENGEPVLNKDGKTISDYVAGEGLIMEGYDRATRGNIGWAEINAVITLNCENVDVAVRLLDYWGSEEFTMVSVMGVEGVDYWYLDTLPDEIKNAYINPWTVTGSSAYDEIRTIWRPAKAEIEEGGAFYGTEYDSVRIYQTPAVIVLNGMGVYNAGFYMAANTWTKAEGFNPQRYIQKAHLEEISNVEVVSGIIYTDEETEENTELWSPIKSYIDECFVAFCLGEMDIDGADWDKYVEECKKMGIDDYIENVQAAYDRTYGETGPANAGSAYNQ